MYDTQLYLSQFCLSKNDGVITVILSPIWLFLIAGSHLKGLKGFLLQKQRIMRIKHFLS